MCLMQRASPTRLGKLGDHIASKEPVGRQPVNADLGKAEVYVLRKKHFSKAQSISYENTAPLLIVRGDRQYLYDEAGTRYLDTRNNVGHCGHSHPKVAAAVAEQVGSINTNTRYLHQNVVLLAERLAATMPDSLEVSNGRRYHSTAQYCM